MRDDLKQRLETAAGSAPDNGSFDEVWLRATQIQRRRAGIFSALAASLSLVVVMSAGALTSSSDLKDRRGVTGPVASPSTAHPTAATVTVPDVVGLPAMLAEEILRDAGLKPMRDPELEPDLAGEIDCDPLRSWHKKGEGSKDKGVNVSVRCFFVGNVTRQDPLPGTIVAIGTEVRLDGPYDVIIEEAGSPKENITKLDRKLSREAARLLSKLRAERND